MNIMQAVSSVYRQYVGFSGRASRSEFWWFWLFYVIVSIVLSVIGGYGSATGGALVGLFALGSLLPSLAVAVRRLHDIGRSGWWLLIGIIPIVDLVLLWWYIQPSTAEANQYGPPPGAPASAGGPVAA
jgi:uncharacterized membrane protein YhaH (DUF805 family)